MTDQLPECPPAWDALPDFGLYMDQMLLYTQRFVPVELTAGMVNSYVKAGIMDRPKGKKYGRAALAQLLMIAALKQVVSLENLRRLLHPAEEESAPDTEALYGRFRAAWARLAEALPLREDVPALELCVEAAEYQYLCRQKLSGQPEPED